MNNLQCKYVKKDDAQWGRSQNNTTVVHRFYVSKFRIELKHRFGDINFFFFFEDSSGYTEYCNISQKRSFQF